MSTLSAYAYEKSENRNLQIVFFSFSFFIPFIFLVLRYDDGTDYMAYVDIFHIIKSGFSSYVEPAYYAINLLVEKLGLGYEWVFIVSGFIFMFFVYSAIPKEGFALGMFLFIDYYYFLGGYNQVRQGIASAIMAYSIKFIFEKKRRYFIYNIFAILFHTSAVVFLPLYLFANKYINRYLLMLAILIAYTIHIIGGIELFIALVTKTFFPGYEHLVTSEKFGIPLSTNVVDTKILPFLNLLFGLVIFANKDKIVEKFPISNVYINLFTIYLMFYFWRYNMIILERIQFLFIIPAIIMIVYAIKSLEIHYRKIAIFIIGVVSFLYYMLNVYAPGRHVRPYQTILFDKD